MYVLPLVLVFAVTACNNDKDTAADDASKAMEHEADSLWKKVNEGHDIGMAKMKKLEDAKLATQSAIDSIGKLPAAAKAAAASFKTNLDSLKKDLDYANVAMEKWMMEMNWEAQNMPVKERIPYLNSEIVKVQAMKAAILNSLAKADSLLQRKF